MASTAAPIVATSSGTVTAQEQIATAVDNGLTLSDADSSSLASASVAITGNFASGQDVLAFTNGNTATYGNIAGTYNATTGVLTLTSAGATATIAQFEAALRAVTYTDTSNTPSTAARTISFTANDGVNTSAAATRSLTVTAVNDAPVVGGLATAVDYVEQAAATPVAGAVTLTDPDSTTLLSATVTLTGARAGDALSASNTFNFTTTTVTTSNSITLTFSSAAPVDIATFQDALRTVTFRSTSDNPGTSRTVSVTANDGSATSTPATTTIAITPVNDAPAGTNRTITGNEDAPVTITAADFGFTDVDGNALRAVRFASLPGSSLTYGGQQVVTGTDYAITANGGQTFTYTPTANLNGTAVSTLTFQVVDDGGTSNNGVDTDPSPNTLTFNLVAVNDAPIASGTAQLAATQEDAASPPGETVASLFGANLSDAADQQTSGSNPSGSAANALAGIAVVGNATPATQGVWRYSLDNGVSWTALPAGLSDANALVLSASARLDFLPAANFNGSPPPLQVRLIDSSTDVPVSGSTTGAALAASTQAIAGVDVSGARQGGSTAISAARVTLSTSVSAVNDAPIASGAAQLTAIDEDAASPPGATIASLFVANFADTADAQASVANPTGSMANTLAGVALVGNATLLTQGTWRYSLDGGTSFTNVPAGLSDLNALLLPATAQFQFVPGPDFVGRPLPLTVRLIDSSTQVPLFGTFTGVDLVGSTQAIAGVDVSGTRQGGATAVSARTVPLSVLVQSVNDAPVNTVPAGLVYAPGSGGGPVPGLSIADADAGSSNLTTRLDVLNGVLIVAPAQGGATVAGSGTGTVILTGTIEQINTSLGGVVFRGTPGLDAQLTVTTNDGGNTGAGGAMTDIDQVTIRVPAAPAGPGPDPVPGPTLGDDNLAGTSGPDTISLLTGNDIFAGGAGNDLIYGNQGNDLIYGNQDADTLYGGQGDDRAYGGQGDDRLYGNLGNDVLFGNLGNDVVYGNQGEDIVYGNQGADILFGGQGNDVLYGGQGDDTLVGGVGDDILVGGLGADLYRFDPNSGRDLILGFNQADGDRIALGGQTYTVSSAQNGDALLTLSGGGVVDLAGVRADQVNASYFAA